jgi:hypothetical protein
MPAPVTSRKDQGLSGQDRGCGGPQAKSKNRKRLLHYRSCPFKVAEGK